MRRTLFAASALSLLLIAGGCQQAGEQTAPAGQAQEPTTQNAQGGEAVGSSKTGPVEEGRQTQPSEATLGGQPAAPSPTAPTSLNTAVDPQACSSSLGAEQAEQLARICRNVSPATRPPCHPANPCAMIQDEIDRSCALWEKDGDAPDDCKAARPARP